MTSYQRLGDTDSWLTNFRNLPLPERPSGIPFPSTYEFFLSPYTPIAFAIIYSLAVNQINSLPQSSRPDFTSPSPQAKKGEGEETRVKLWRWGVLSHNIFLAAYSAWTFWNVAPAVLSSFVKGWLQDGVHGLASAFCDSTYSLWDSYFARYGYIFYLSKYYEVIDTVIILCKGKKAQLLQEYHHAGALLTMWSAFRTKAAAIWIFVVFNSFIHSIMYTYYAFSSLKLPFPRALKKSLTTMQITQFLVGGSLAVSYLFVVIPPALSQKSSSSTSSKEFNILGGLSSTTGSNESQFLDDGYLKSGECLRNDIQRYAVWLNIAYLTPLTYLFMAFWIASYTKKSPKNAKKDL